MLLKERNAVSIARENVPVSDAQLVENGVNNIGSHQAPFSFTSKMAVGAKNPSLPTL